jgi:hypothetical protein
MDAYNMAKFQADQQKRAQTMGFITKGIGLAAAPFTGGLSLGLGMGSGGFSGMMSGLGQSVGQGIMGGMGGGSGYLSGIGNNNAMTAARSSGAY